MTLPKLEKLIFFLALDLSKEQKLNFGDDIAFQLRAARKKKFSIQEEKRISQEIELQTYLNRLIREDKERQINSLRMEESDNNVRNEKVLEIEETCVSCW